MKLADYVLEYLKNIGIKQVFLVYGAATGDLVDAFSRVKGIEYICPIHEQAGSFMIETIAKVTKHIQCFMATSAPGGLNTLDGIANCYFDSTPALFITGQVNSKFLRKVPEQRQIGFQENDIVSMAKPITKYAVMVTAPEKIKYELDKAVYLATSGRQAPVLVDIPTDLQKKDIEPDKLIGYKPKNHSVPQWYYNESLAIVTEALMEAKRPVILAGGGVHWANGANVIRKLGTKLKVPCIPTWNATDIFTCDYPYYAGRIGTFGGAGRNFTVQNCDLLLSIGSRISGRITGGQVAMFARGAKKIIVDIDPYMLDENNQEVKGDMNICMDGKKFCESLMNYMGNEPLPDWSDWLKQAIKWRDKYPMVLPEYYKYDKVHPYVFMKTLSEVCKPGDIIVCDSGGNAVVTFQCFETKWGQRVLSSNGNSTMGYSFAGAMGLSFLPEYLKEDKGCVICIIGDGGMQMNIQELQTLKHYGLRLKTFVIQNMCYGITTRYQINNYGGRLLASGHGDTYQAGYSVPDFCKIANAYGINAGRISNMDNLRKNILEILEYPESVVCEVMCEGFSTYEPRIFGWKTPIEDMMPYVSREEFRKNMSVGIGCYEGWEHPAMPNGDSNQSLGLA